MSATDRTRQPAGSPTGGEFAAEPGAEAATSLTPEGAWPTPPAVDALIAAAAAMTEDDVKALVAAGARRYNRWPTGGQMWNPLDDEYTWEYLEEHHRGADQAAFEAGWAAQCAARPAERAYARGWVGYSGQAADAIACAAQALTLRPLFESNTEPFTGGMHRFNDAVAPVKAVWPHLFDNTEEPRA